MTKDFIAELSLAFPYADDNPKWDLQNTKKFVSNQSNLFLIGYIAGNMAGYLFGHKLDRFDKRKEFFIYELYTSKAFRREKVMTRTLEYLLEHLIAQRFTSAWVLTNRRNKPAVAFYTTTGGSIPNGDDILFEYKLK